MWPRGNMEGTRDEKLAMVEIAVQGIIFTLALFGNLFVLLALLRYSCRYPLSRMYWFMLHLSIADLLVAIFNILPQMLWDITFRFQGGDALCRVVKYMQVMPLYLSTYILVMMALDRFRAVVYTKCCSFGAQWSTKRTVHLSVGIAWIIAIVLSVPQPFLFAKQEISPGSGIYDCWVHFRRDWGPKFYVTWFLASIFLIPLAILVVTQTIMCVKIVAWGDCVNKAKAKTVKLTLVVIIAYVLCWAPWVIALLINTYSTKDVLGNYISLYVSHYQPQVIVITNVYRLCHLFQNSLGSYISLSARKVSHTQPTKLTNF